MAEQNQTDQLTPERFLLVTRSRLPVMVLGFAFAFSWAGIFMAFFQALMTDGQRFVPTSMATQLADKFIVSVIIGMALVVIAIIARMGFGIRAAARNGVSDANSGVEFDPEAFKSLLIVSVVMFIPVSTVALVWMSPFASVTMVGCVMSLVLATVVGVLLTQIVKRSSRYIATVAIAGLVLCIITSVLAGVGIGRLVSDKGAYPNRLEAVQVAGTSDRDEAAVLRAIVRGGRKGARSEISWWACDPEYPTNAKCERVGSGATYTLRVADAGNEIVARTPAWHSDLSSAPITADGKLLAAR
jgi:hypothetical protein